ncbi:MAG: cupin domain-containing protein [Chromatocurvus sp.]
MMTLKQVFAGLSLAALLPLSAGADVVKPAEMSRDDLAGGMFDSPDTVVTESDGGRILDITSLLSSDGRFASGMYRAGKSRFEINEPYGVDEFMYFLEGSVTLTSADGSQQVIEAGEAVTIPKEWTGIWETDGYTKIWVIYSEDGSALE